MLEDAVLVSFESPRFSGDPVLEEILDDPDTGSFKLKKGSPAASVIPVQRALYDLRWPERAEPPVQVSPFSPDGFADGDYGPATDRTVLGYKKQYDIHFPPSAPTGVFDGFAGPRTLAALDRHCVLFDELEPALAAKFEELSAGAATSGTITRIAPVLGTAGMEWVVSVGERAFHLYAKRGVGAFAVSDPIAPAYVFRSGGPTGPLGWPVADAADEASGDVRQDFEFGSLRFTFRDGSTEPLDLVPPDGAPPDLVTF